MLNPLLRMLVEAIGNILFRHPRFDMVALHLLDDLNSIFSDTEKWSSHGTVLDWPCWANEHDPVRHVRTSQAKVRFWLVLPLLVEVDAIPADYREAWLVCNVKAGCADDCVDFAVLAIVADDASLVDLIHCCEVYVDVLLLDGVHVWVARRDAAAYRVLETRCRVRTEILELTPNLKLWREAC
jgi:hypothetical protein